MDRHVVFQRERARYTEWLTERRVWIACALGALCFGLGYLAASPRLHAAKRLSRATAPVITRRGPAAVGSAPEAPDIRISESAGGLSAGDAWRASKSRASVGHSNAEVKRRLKAKRRIRRVPEEVSESGSAVSEKSKSESQEPVIIYSPSESEELDPSARRDLEDGLRRELGRNPPD